MRTQQYYLNAIKTFDAWDVNQGDTSVVIAIVDTGTDLDHPDLVNNLALNHSDTINGIDDDNDGYIDNYYGWNVASNNDNVSFLAFCPARQISPHFTLKLSPKNANSFWYSKRKAAAKQPLVKK